MKFNELAEKIKISRAALEKDKDIEICTKKLEQLAEDANKTHEEIDERLTSVAKQTGESLEMLTQILNQVIVENETNIKRLSEENGSLFARLTKAENALAELTRQRIL